MSNEKYTYPLPFEMATIDILAVNKRESNLCNDCGIGERKQESRQSSKHMQNVVVKDIPY